MIGNNKCPHAELISPQEAVALALKFSTVQSAYIAEDIEREYMKQTEGEKSPRWRYGWLLATLYNAGRIQGIREERQRRKPKPLTL